MVAHAEEVYGEGVGALLCELGILQDGHVVRVDGLGGKLEEPLSVLVLHENVVLGEELGLCIVQVHFLGDCDVL